MMTMVVMMVTTMTMMMMQNLPHIDVVSDRLN
jgi:hypothetical protein